MIQKVFCAFRKKREPKAIYKYEEGSRKSKRVDLVIQTISMHLENRIEVQYLC
jgi:hypothetical protein